MAGTFEDFLSFDPNKVKTTGYPTTTEEKKPQSFDDFLAFQPKQEAPIQPQQPADTRTEWQKQDAWYRSGKFITKTAARATDLTAKTVDFLGDFVVSNIEKIPGAVVFTKFPQLRPLIQKTEKATIEKPESQDKLTEWKNAYTQWSDKYGTDKIKQISEKLNSWEAFAPTKEWQDAPLGKKFSSKYIFETAFEVGPDVISSMGIYALNPAAGFVVSAGATAEDVKDSALAHGVSKKNADYLGLTTGLLVGMIDRWSAGKVLEGIPKEKFAASTAKNLGRWVIDFVKKSAEEATTETVQEWIQMAAEKTFRDDLGLDEAKTRSAMSAFGGALGGAMGHFVSTTANKIAEKERIAQREEIGQLLEGIATPTAPTPEVVTPTAPTPEVVTPTAPAPEVVTPTAPAPEVVTPTAPAPEVVTPTAPTPEVEEKTFEDIPESIRTIAEEDWQDNYAEKYGELYNKSSELQNKIKEAKKKEKPSLQKKLDSVNEQMGILKNEFTQKYKQQLSEAKIKPVAIVEAIQAIPVKKLAQTASAISRGTRLPILKTIRVKDGKASATNLNFSLTANTDIAPGMYESSKGALIKSNQSEDAFPDIVVHETQEKSFDIKSRELAKAIDSFKNFIDEDSTNENITGLSIIVTGNRAQLMGTDSYRMLIKNIDIDSVADGSYNMENPFLVSRSVELLGNTVSLSTGKEWITMHGDNGSIATKRIGDAPAYKTIIPKFNKQYAFNKKSFLNAIATLKPIYSLNFNNAIHIEFNENNTATIFASDKDGINKNQVTIEALPRTIDFDPVASNSMQGAYVMPLNFEGIQNSFNAEYLVDALKSVEEDTAFMQQSAVSPVTRFSAEEELEAPIKSKKGEALADKGAMALNRFENRLVAGNVPGGFKIFEESYKLIQKYAKRVTQDRVPSGTLGVFNRATETIRVKSLNDLSVVAHEITHFIDKAFSIRERLKEQTEENKSLRQGLTDLYVQFYPGAKKNHKLSLRLAEGYATLLQKYTETPSTIESAYPNLVAEFLAPGGAYYEPVVGDMLSDLNKIIVNYQSLAPLDKIGTRVVTGEFESQKDEFLNTGDKVRKEVSDRIFPVEKLDIVSGVQWTDQSVSLPLRQYSNAGAIANNNVIGDKGYWAWRNGQLTNVLNFNYNDLIRALEESGVTDQFNYYLVARQQYFSYLELQELDVALAAAKEAALSGAFEGNIEDIPEYVLLKNKRDELRQTLLNDGFDKDTVVKAYNENKSRFAKYADMYDKLNAEQIATLSDPEVQLIDKQREKELLSKKGYASLKRAFINDIIGAEELPKALRVGKTRISSLLQRTGSTKPIIAPLYSAVLTEFEIQKKSAKQIIWNKIAKLAVDAKAPDMLNRVEIKTVKNSDGSVSFPQEKDPNIIMGRVGYKRVAVEMDAQLKQVIDNVLTVKNIGAFSKILIHATRAFVGGTTATNPFFAAANLLIDSISLTAQTRNNVVPIVTAVKQLSTALKNNDSEEYKYMMEYLVGAGLSQSFSSFHDMTPEEAFKKIAHESRGLEKVADAVGKGADIVSLPSRASEIASRIAEYISARKNGKSYRVAMEEAARVTASFTHRGNYGSEEFVQRWIQSVPFLNASVQVIDTSLRAIEDPKMRKRFIITTAAVSASMISTMALLVILASKRQRELLADLSPEELGSYIFLPHPTNKNKLVRLRVPQQMTFVAGLINMAMVEQAGLSDFDFNEYVSGALGWLPQPLHIWQPAEALLSVLPQLISPSIRVAANIKTYPEVRPLESQYQLLKPKSERFTKTTSKVAKLLSAGMVKMLGEKNALSPVQIDYWIRNTFGSMSDFITLRPGAYNPFRRFEHEYIFDYSRKLKKFYDIKDLNDIEYGQLKKGKEFSDKEATMIEMRHDKIKEIEKFLKQYKDTDLEKDTAEATALIREMNTIIDELTSIK